MQQDGQLFHLSIDVHTKAHLSETARWARFLALVGMVMLVVAFLVLLLVAGMISASGSSMEGGFGDAFPVGSLGIFMVVYYMIILGIWFFPLLYLLRFANSMRTALQGNDQQALDQSFQNLKACFRFVGIVTIIMLAMMVLGLVFGIIGVFFLAG